MWIGDVELVGALDEIEALDRERRLGVAEDPLGLQLLEARVRAVAADALGVEDADADDEVVDRDAARAARSGSSSGSPLWNTWPALPVRAGKLHVGDLDLARSPAAFGRAEHVGRPFRGLDGMSGRTADAGSSGDTTAADSWRPRVAGRQLLAPRWPRRR